MGFLEYKYVANAPLYITLLGRVAHKGNVGQVGRVLRLRWCCRSCFGNLGFCKRLNNKKSPPITREVPSES